MEKPKITKEQLAIAKTLNSYYKGSNGKEMMVKHFIEDKRSWNPHINVFTSTLSLESFLQIFVFGQYELIKSKEDLVKDYYTSLSIENESIINQAKMRSINKVLDILEIKIEGVNA